MISLPRLLLTANAAAVLDICGQMYQAQDPVECDASQLVAAEPLALCALAATLSRMQRHGRPVTVIGLKPWLKANLERLDILSDTLHVGESSSATDRTPEEMIGSLHAYRVRTIGEGNKMGNAIAQAVASLVPMPYPQPEVSPAHHPLAIPLAYLFTELIDNAFSHGRARGYTHGTVWTSAQYFPPGELIRIAVADDGCGFHATLQGRRDLQLTSMPMRSALRSSRIFPASATLGYLPMRSIKDSVSRSVGISRFARTA